MAKIIPTTAPFGFSVPGRKGSVKSFSSAPGHISVKIEGMQGVLKAMQRLGDARTVLRVVKRTWSSDARKKVKPRIQKHVQNVFHGKRPLKSSYAAFVSGTHLFNLRMDVYSHLKMAIPHELGPAAPIRAKSGGWLTIPTEFASGTGLRFIEQAGVQLPRRIRTRFKASHLKKRGKKQSNVFIKKSKKGNLIIFQRLAADKGSKLYKAQKKRIRRGGKKLGDVENNLIPLFVLKKVVKLKKRTRVRNIFRYELVNPIAQHTQRNLVREFERDVGGSA